MKSGITRKKLLAEYLRNISRTQRILWGDAERMLDMSLTEAQRQTLFVIAEADGMTVTDIAQRLQVTNGAVTQLVDGLVKQKAVERRQSQIDARKVHVTLTDYGKQKLNEMGKAYENKLGTILKNVTDEQLETLLEIQREVIRHGEHH